MAFENISPNMNLPIPGVGLTDGPQWAVDVNDCLDLIDSHDHSNGQGVQITPAGININSDLPMNSNNMTLVRSVRFSSQLAPLSLPADLGCLYESGVDLYFNDGNGNPIRLTQAGSVVGTPGSITGLTPPASATYVAGDGTFVWQQAVNVAANMDMASIILRNPTLSSNGLTLSPPILGTDYTITLPALPSVTSNLAIDPSGNMVTVPINSQVSANCGLFTTTSVTPVDVTNLSVTIVATGRPIAIGVLGVVSGVGGGLAQIAANGNPAAYINTYLVKDGTALYKGPYSVSVAPGQGTTFEYPPPGIIYIDNPSPGSHTYKFQMDAAGATLAEMINCIMVAYEL